MHYLHTYVYFLSLSLSFSAIRCTIKMYMCICKAMNCQRFTIYKCISLVDVQFCFKKLYTRSCWYNNVVRVIESMSNTFIASHSSDVKRWNVALNLPKNRQKRWARGWASFFFFFYFKRPRRVKNWFSNKLLLLVLSAHEANLKNMHVIHK